MEKEFIAENEINILDMLFVVRKNLVKIVIAAVLVAILSLAYTLTMVTPMYRSTTQLLIKGISQEAMTIYPDSTARIMLVNNSIEVLRGTEVMLDVIDELSLEMTPEELQSCVSVSSPADTQVLKISVTSPDPEFSKNVTSKMAQIAHKVLAETVGISAMSTIQEAKTPTAPVSPNPAKNTILGGFLGAVLAAGFFILIWFVNNKIHTVADLERSLGLTVFSAVPFVEPQSSEDETEGADSKKDNGKKKSASKTKEGK